MPKSYCSFTSTSPLISPKIKMTRTNCEHHLHVRGAWWDMESEENKLDLFPILRAKRTKRYIIHSPHATLSSEVEETARCLILLAQGHFSDHKTATAPHVKEASCMYACKTCNRAFRSFQALGGHRASHKKERKVALSLNEDDFLSPALSSSEKRMPSDYLSLQLNDFPDLSLATRKPALSPRIHICLHCGAEFTSGQALGGHMRRHRSDLASPSPNPNAAYIYIEGVNGDELIKPAGIGLALDLNLPAPELALTLKD